jgi:GMP synthase PP-ATPase subunit
VESRTKQWGFPPLVASHWAALRAVEMIDFMTAHGARLP